MLNHLIRFSLKNRALVIAVALLVLLMGLRTATELPVEVLPDMTKPTVTTPFSPPSGPPQRLFQGPPAKSKFLATKRLRNGQGE